MCETAHLEGINKVWLPPTQNAATHCVCVACGDQVWSYDEKGVSPEGKWHAVLVSAPEKGEDGVMRCKRSFKTTSGEKATFWATIGLWSRADGQCPVEPIVVHQAAKLSLNHTENLGGGGVQGVC